ncbi:plasmid partitioning protein RepB [Sulfitobacter albidus]|uniref:Plasmid partitioning protein RepB n=1 Tax=Sulfitobacter albidus TaxID=2829501 RepID=A0A975PNV8_9RHOB|nr:plasmid partitioning protein RepB [Sulfitobacter albidus]QUJ78257.1 plasmid partitioning protein RepB [Sulfitobacter albidus]
MARKDLMKGLMSDTPKAEPPARVDAAKPRYSKGAIGAVSRSIEDLKRRSIVEVDPSMVDGAGLKDRLDPVDPELDALKKSIEIYGQQVPVLLRPNPNDPERYEVVYGRRRVAALKALRLPVKAMVRVLDDRALVLAQGQENTARKDLTFIEKANFARQMRDAGYDRKIMGDALSMDKTLISRMLAVADKVPLALIEAIGSAPGIGRDRWLALAERIGKRDLTEAATGASSDARFNAVMAALKAPRPAPPKPQTVADAEGTPLAQIKQTGTRTTLSLDAKNTAGFDQWLIDHLPEIHRRWKNERGE